MASIEQQVLGYLNRRDRSSKKLDPDSLQGFHGHRVAREADEPVRRPTTEGGRLTKEIQFTNDQIFEKLTSLEENLIQQRPSCGSTKEKDLAKLKQLATEMDKKLDAEPMAHKEQTMDSSIQFFQKCEPFYGYEFVNEIGQTRNIKQISGESYEHCEKHCLEENDCDAWTYDKKNKYCNLKDVEMSNSLGGDWSIDLVSVRMESCIHKVDFCSVVLDGNILVHGDDNYERQASNAHFYHNWLLFTKAWNPKYLQKKY